MSKHRSAALATVSANHSESRWRLQAALLATLAALFVARPLLPSEAVAWLGDGQPFNMLVLCLAAVTCLAAVGKGGLVARWTPTDAAVLLLFAWYAASALRAAAYASPRAAFNMLWEWAALGFVYFLVRQLVRTAAQRRAVVAVMIALAVVLSSYGYYQYFVSMPADRAEYTRDPDAMLRRNDLHYERGSSERQQFESRLRSTEPLATFALTNSLAGYLAPWLIVAAGIGAGVWASRRSSATDDHRAGHDRGTRRTGITLAVTVMLVGGCLVLTKSRSAYVASAAGLLLLPLTLPTVRGRIRWRMALAAAAGVGVLVVGAIVVRGLDRAVLSEAGKSLGYRLEYWQSTLAMIRDQPWFGCGPGNFQDAYMRYKLPQASEEIQDPHNLFFEVWATAGTPALLALMAALGVFGWQSWKRSISEPKSSEKHPPAPANTIGIVAGAAIGLGLANFVGPLVGLDFDGAKACAGLAIGALVVFGLWPWIRAGWLPAALAPLGVLVLVVHLLAAGGIGFPGVAYSLWILLALGVNQTRGAQAAPDEEHRDVAASGATKPPVPWGCIAAMSVAGALATACYLTAYGPVLRATAAMYRVQTEEQRMHSARREAALAEASQADPLSAQTWQMLADLDFQRVSRRGSGDVEREQFDRSVRMMLRLRPQSSGAYRQAGQWCLELFRQHGHPDDRRHALEFFGQAAELYPNSAGAHADFAFALAAASEPVEAEEQARRAQQLDAGMPHADKKLPAETITRLEALLPAADLP